MSPPIFATQRLEHRFGRLAVLRGVDLQVHTGDVILLTGANGAGKSTLLRIACGLMRPTGGTVRVDGRDPGRELAARATIGFLSHQTLLYDDLTAQENLRFAAALYGLAGASTRVRDALDAAGLTPRADHRAGALSHGTRQRLAIARAVLHRPSLLLLDEPFSGLDSAAVGLLRETIAATAHGGAVVCATHQPEECWALVTRIVALRGGVVVMDTPRPDSIARFAADYQRVMAA